MRPLVSFLVVLSLPAAVRAQEATWRAQDAAVVHADRPVFCAGARPLRAPATPAAGDRWALIEIEADCSSIPNARCLGGPGLNPVRVRPTTCVVERAYAGTATGRVRVPLPVEDATHCGVCPPTDGERTSTDGSFRQCGEAEIALARRQPVLFDVRAAEVRRLQDLYAEAMRIRAAQGPVAEWQNRLLEIARGTARTLGYCDAAPPLLPHDERWTWTYEDHRVDLAKNLVFGGRTQGEGTALEIEPLPEILHAYPGAFVGATRDVLDFDALAMALLHEMRHMATYQFGSGMARHSAEERDAEHRLNELQDYTEMFRHPFFATVPAAGQAAMRRDFGVGRQAELECFAVVWGAGDRAHGYPDERRGARAATRPSLGAPMMGGIGGMGLLGPLMLGAMPAGAGAPAPLRPAMVPPATAPRRCEQTALRPPSRCRVAHWAARNHWMRAMMVRSGFTTGEAQPWNTLAHHVLALPFRARQFCPPEPE